MRKFTIFTAILTVIIMIMVAQIVVSDYLPEWGAEDEEAFTLSEVLEEGSADVIAVTNKLGDDIDEDSEDTFSATIEEVVEEETLIEEVDELPVFENDVVDFEDAGYVAYSPNAYIREEQVKAAGFARGYLEEEPHSGYLYKTVYIDDLSDTALRKFMIRDASLLYAKVYVFSPGPKVNLDQLYNVLMNRSAEGLHNEVNETNQFGLASFYMNDASRLNTAFLTVKFDDLIYGISYPKEYHKQVTNLIKLIDLEK